MSAVPGRRIAPALLVALLAACGGGGSGDAGRAGAGREASGGAAGQANAAGGAASGDAATAVPGAPRPACTYTGRWDRCTIAERLDRSGLAPQPVTDAAPHAQLGAPAAAWMVGNARLLVFVYPDKGAREAAQEKLPPAQYLTPQEEVGMNALPTLIASENLLAILDSRNEHQRERVADAITAGPPQAAR